MIFIPTRSNILVEIIEEKRDSRILIPTEDLKTKPFMLCKIISKGADVTNLKKGDLIVVRTEGIETVTLKGEQFKIVATSYIVGEINEA